MRKSTKILILILSILLILFFILSAALPAWVSSPTGTQTVLKWINGSMEGKLSIEKLELSWLGPQHIEKLKLVDERGNEIVNFLSFDTETSLLYLLFGGRRLGATRLEEPYVYLTEKVKEKLQKEKPKGRQKEREGIEWNYPTFKDSLSVTNGTVILLSKDLPPITISGIQVEKQADTNRFYMKAKTMQGTKEGTITVVASFLEKFLATVHIQDLPLAILDEFDHSTFYTDALGATLTVDLNIEKEKGGALSIAGSAQSAHLTAHIEGVTKNKTFILSPQTHLEFTLTPAFFKQLIAEKERGDWELASKTKLEMTLQKGVFPLRLQQPDYRDVILQASAKIDRAELHHKALGSYSLKQFDVAIVALNNLEISYQGEIQGKEATKLSGNVSITPKGELLFFSSNQGFPVTLLSLASSQLETHVRSLLGSQIDVESHGTFINGTLDAYYSIHSTDTEI